MSPSHGRGPLCSSAQGLSCQPLWMDSPPSVPEITALAHVKLHSAFPCLHLRPTGATRSLRFQAAHIEEVGEADWRPGPFFQPRGFKAGCLQVGVAWQLRSPRAERLGQPYGEQSPSLDT